MDQQPGAVYGLDSPVLPEGWTPFEAITIIKCLDGDGDQRLCLRVTRGWTLWEGYGALSATAEATKTDVLKMFSVDGRADEDNPTS